MYSAGALQQQMVSYLMVKLSNKHIKHYKHHLKGTRQQNDLYEELLKLGVVNSNVRLGDLTRLLEDVNFGETMTSDKGLECY